jgi:DNA-directed RNA polymerase specialized sigma24 family protein
MTMTYAQPLTRRYTRARLAVPALWRQVIRTSDGAVDKAEQQLPEPDRSAHTQLEIYDGVLAAFERRDEVAAVLRAAADRATAVRRLRDEFGLSHLQATALIDLPLTTECRDRIAHRAEELRAALER